MPKITNVATTAASTVAPAIQTSVGPLDRRVDGDAEPMACRIWTGRVDSTAGAGSDAAGADAGGGGSVGEDAKDGEALPGGAHEAGPLGGGGAETEADGIAGCEGSLTEEGTDWASRSRTAWAMLTRFSGRRARQLASSVTNSSRPTSAATSWRER
jgi:hypothetical protein